MIKLIACDYKEFINKKVDDLKEKIKLSSNNLINSNYFDSYFLNCSNINNKIDKHLLEYEKLKNNNQFDVLGIEYSLEIISEIYSNIQNLFIIPRQHFFNFNFFDFSSYNPIIKKKHFQENEFFIFMMKIWQIFMIEWKTNKFFNDFVRYKMSKAMNKKKPQFLDTISISEFKFDVEDFFFKNISLISFSENEICFDLDIFLKGNVEIEIKTKYIPKNSFLKYFTNDLTLNVIVSHLMGKTRILYHPRTLGKSKLSFINSPLMNYKFSFSIGKKTFYPNLNVLGIEDLITKLVLKGFIYPDFASIGIPLTKKNRTKAFGKV